MLGALAAHRSDLVLASVPAEILFADALLFTQDYSLRSLGNFLTVSGFTLWGGVSFVTIGLRHMGISERFIPPFMHSPQFLVAVGMTIIVLREDSRSRRERFNEYKDLFDKNPNSVWVIDTQTLRIMQANPASARMHGYSVEELCMKRIADMVPAGLVSSMELDLQGDTPRSNFRTLHLRSDGTTFPIGVTVYSQAFRGRSARIVMGVDLTESEKMSSKLIYQAHHDLLTGLPSRQYFREQLDETVAVATREATGCALIVLQICRFEKINEYYGHPVGDRLLQEVTRQLQAVLGPCDALGRTGGREFSIAIAALPDASAAEQAASDLLKLFVEPLVVDDCTVNVAVSMGVAVFPDDATDAVALWSDAVRAVTQAQQNNTQNAVRLSQQAREQSQEDNRVEALMVKALAQGGFHLVYQPIVDANRKLCGFEALLRLTDIDGTTISPAVCIPVAEASGLIVPIGRWVLRAVCQQIRDWQEAGLDVVPVAINVSANEVVLTNFASDVTNAVDEFSLDHSLIHFELTESGLMVQETLALQCMKDFDKEGFHLAIDDFGTGFSSLGRLYQMPVSTLKIDRSFIDRMLEVNGTLPIVRTVISMAHALHMSVIAEGVETEAQFDMLCGMDCNFCQGYLFSKPMDPANVSALLRNGTS